MAGNKFDYSKFFNGVDTGLGLIGDMINTGFNMAGYFDQKEQNRWSREFAQQQFDYQKGLNYKLFEREDNAVQRRALDLQKAELSKTLAAGSAASSTVAGISPTSAPQNSNKFMDKAILKTNILNNKLNVERTNADNELKRHEGELIKTKAKTEDTQQALNKAMEGYYNSSSDLNNAKTLSEKYRLEYANSMETSLDDSGIHRDKVQAIIKGVQFAVRKGIKVGKWLAEKVEDWNKMSPKDKAIILRESEKYAKKAEAIQALYGGSY